MNRFVCFASLLALALFSMGAVAGPIDPAFNFTFVIGADTGFGNLNTVDQGNGSFLAIGGSMTVTGGPDIGPYVLGPGGPANTMSPSGHIIFDNLIFPGSNPVLDSAGLLFVGGGLEINLGGLAANSYFYVSCPVATTRCNTVSLGTPFSLTRVPEPATLALLGIGLAGLGFSRRKQGSLSP